MTYVRRQIGYPANEPVSESALDKHNAENDVYRVLYGGRVPENLRAGNAESPERPAHDKATEQGWREQSAQWTSPHRVCLGSSCRQGRMPCREACNEMACTAGADPKPWWSPNGLIAGAIVLGLIAIVLWGPWILALSAKWFN